MHLFMKALTFDFHFFPSSLFFFLFFLLWFLFCGLSGFKINVQARVLGRVGGGWVVGLA